MEDTLKVFCYGSNMSYKRLKKRCPSAKFICKAHADGYIFKFNKKSTLGNGSGKGNMISTNDVSASVWGVVFEIPRNEEIFIDEAEGLGNGGYKKMVLKVSGENGEQIETIAYIATDPAHLDDNELPFEWYKNHCLIGARQYNLPKVYIDYLNSFTTKTDSNKKRLKKETEIYS